MNSKIIKLLAILGFAAITAFCYSNRYEMIENDLLSRSQEALRHRNLPGGIVRLSGRDALLSGILQSSEAIKTAEDIVSDVYGVRKVTNRLTAGAGADDESPVLTTQKDASKLEKQISDLFEEKAVSFETNTARLTAECISILDTLTIVLHRNHGYNLEIRGHTDSSGDRLFNLQLSRLRAEAVKDFLVQKGISEERLTSVGLGESEPRTDNFDEYDRSANRRVEFRIKEEMDR